MLTETNLIAVTTTRIIQVRYNTSTNTETPLDEEESTTTQRIPHKKLASSSQTSPMDFKSAACAGRSNLVVCSQREAKEPQSITLPPPRLTGSSSVPSPPRALRDEPKIFTF
ncbi:hypothetical protein R3I93_013321 [Phoxinus phoxinus]|uniref:Uncharacterized protein n=1 Tax=Phoxinus phoxinus TaxID=58324 RepID=A0AAN9H0M6_9TELE